MCSDSVKYLSAFYLHFYTLLFTKVVGRLQNPFFRIPHQLASNGRQKMAGGGGKVAFMVSACVCGSGSISNHVRDSSSGGGDGGDSNCNISIWDRT